MAYVIQDWTDDVTPLDEAHMDHIEAGIATLDGQVTSLDGEVTAIQSDVTTLEGSVAGKADKTYVDAADAALNAALAGKADTAAMTAADLLKVDKDGVVNAATRIVASKLLAADANPAFQIGGDGKLQWGQGGANALDTSLYRWAGGQLRTPGALYVEQLVQAVYGAAGQITLGSDTITFGLDAALYLRRGSATVLATNGQMYTGQATPRQAFLGAVGPGGEAGLGLGQLTDAKLYRQAAGVLRTDGTIDANVLSVNGVPVGTSGPVDITGKVDKDSVVVAATRILASKLLVGDAQPAVRVLGDGRIDWGPGGGSSLDVNLYRSSAARLTTDNSFDAGDITARPSSVYQTRIGYTGAGAPGIAFGFPLDTNLYRSAAAVLKTDGSFSANGNLSVLGGNAFLARDSDVGGRVWLAGRVTTDTVDRFNVFATGQINWGAGGSSAVDTNLYRAATGVLKTDDNLQALTMSVIGAGSAWGMRVQRTGDTGWRWGVDVGGTMLWDGGTGTYDTTLYRSAAGQLKTDGYLYAGQAFRAMLGSSTEVALVAYMGAYAAVEFAGDTRLYRSAAGQLKTDGLLQAGANLVAQIGASGQVDLGNQGGGVAAIRFGSAYDTNLYRASAGMLKTDTDFWVHKSLVLNTDNAGKVYFGSAWDTNLYRSFAGGLKTDGQLMSNSVIAANDGDAFRTTIGYTGGSAGISMGGDTNLYRAAAGELRTGGALTLINGGPTGTQSKLLLTFNTVGVRTVEVGAADSAGAGYRTVRVPN